MSAGPGAATARRSGGWFILRPAGSVSTIDRGIRAVRADVPADRTARNVTTNREATTPATAGRIGPAGLEAVLDALLAIPDTLVYTMGPDGLFVPPPPSLARARPPVAGASTLLDLVIPSDRVVVINTWERAIANGGASAPVRLVGRADHACTMHTIDATARHGVYVAIIETTDESILDGAAPHVDAIPPRVGRVRKDDLAVFLEVDEATTQILGWSAEEMVGRRSLELIHPDDQERALQTWVQLRNTGMTEQSVRLRHRHRDGRWIWFEVTNRNRLRDPEYGCVLAEMVDISDEMAALEALRSREQLLHRLTEALPLGVLQVNPAGDVVYTNARLHEIIGLDHLSRTETLLARVSVADRAALAGALGAGRDAALEITVTCPTGERRCRVEVRSLTGDDGSPSGAIACVEDVTEQRAADVERDRLIAAVEQSTDLVLLTDASNRVVYVNPAFVRVSGWPAEAIRGRHPAVLRSGEHPPEFFEFIEASTAAGEPWRGTVVDRRRDGTPFEQDLAITPIRNAEGVIVGVAEVGRDVSRERVLEAELAEARKMEAIGQLAGGVAQDFNNLLTTIRGFGELVASGLPADSPLRADVAEIQRAASRGADLTRELLAFSRREAVTLAPLDLGDAVEAARPKLRRLVGDGIHIVVDAQPVPAVMADRGQVEQVLVSLASNARDAMPDGGTLTFRVAAAMIDDAFVEAHPESRHGPHVKLDVTDSGSGMDAPTREHLFEPFFTTKGQGKGTGLGLASVYGIVRHAGGCIHVESEPGQGTTFTIYLPVAPERDGDPGVGLPARRDPPARGSETVLFVEDEEAVRAFVTRALERAGFRVHAFGDPLQALAAAEGGLAFDALVSDIVMPGLSGTVLADRLRSRAVDLPIVLVSGFDPEGHAAFGDAFLRKPFSGAELVAAVRRAIDGDAERSGALPASPAAPPEPPTAR